MDLYWLDPTDPVRVQLWDAIHAFALSCGADPNAKPNIERMNAVVAVEQAVAAAANRLMESGAVAKLVEACEAVAAQVYEAGDGKRAVLLPSQVMPFLAALALVRGAGQ